MRTFYRHSYRLLATCLLACMLLTGCGPSEEKIAAAQSKYTQLVDIHNQVVAAHKEISHDTLDSDLTALSEELGQMDHYNLLEMKDEEIDPLIASMDTMIASYEASLASIAQIKAEEKPDFNPVREEPVRFRHMSNEERKALIEKNPAYSAETCQIYRRRI